MDRLFRMIFGDKKKNLRKILSTNYLFHFKLPKINSVLSLLVLIVILYVVGVAFFDIMITKVGFRKILTECFVLKNNFLYQDVFDKIASKLIVYDAKAKDKPLRFIRLGRNNDGGYVVPIEALESADVLMGYGIDDDISFERDFSQRFNKHSFGFDCGVQNIETEDSRCHFFSECIGTSKYLYSNQISSERISSFSDQLQRFKLINKKIFIKMDIEGAEFDITDDILKHSSNITGIVLELHIPYAHPEKALKILFSLDRQFVLVHLHGNNASNHYFNTKYSAYSLPQLLELTYINKNLLSSYEISKNQKHPKPTDQPNYSDIPDCEFEIVQNPL